MSIKSDRWIREMAAKHINSTIVDPKAFDARSFVDFKGPTCVIPAELIRVSKELLGQVSLDIRIREQGSTTERCSDSGSPDEPPDPIESGERYPPQVFLWQSQRLSTCLNAGKEEYAHTAGTPSGRSNASVLDAGRTGVSAA